jgi:hypothetical protein
MASKKIKVGSSVIIPAGTKVTRQGEVTKRTTESVVTIRRLEHTKAGNPKVTWKSNGYMATAILKA